MAIEFLKSANGRLQVNRKYITYYHPAGEIVNDQNTIRYNGFDIDDIEQILSKMKELQGKVERSDADCDSGMKVTRPEIWS